MQRQQGVRVAVRSKLGAVALAAMAAGAVAPRLARAQPADPGTDVRPPGAPATAPAPAPVPVPASIMDEAKIRELVDREVARILTERGAKDAAERAAREATEQSAAAGEDTGDVKGAGGFMDTRLAFTVTNENVLAKPGETTPSSPGWRFGTPSSLGVLFFDSYDTRYSGFETLSHATVYRQYTSGHIQAEGALVLRIDDFSESHIGLSDDGSYIAVSDWKDPSHKDPTRISLTAFPVSSDRFRLGYSYRLSWGGNPEYSRATSSVPGFKLQVDLPAAYAFVGAKSAVVVDPRDGQAKSALAALGGFGIDPLPMLRLEVNGGYFDRGYNELADVQRSKVRLFGASVQASIHRGMPLRSSIDYRLYKFNGESVSDLFAPERYPGGLAWLAQSEFTVLGQTLKDPEVDGGTGTQRGMAADLNVRVKIDRVRLRLDLSYRDLAFVLHSAPSLPAYEQFRPGDTTTADAFAAVGIDHNWGDWLTLGLIGGVEKPATLTSPQGIPGTPTDMGPATAVIRSNNVDTLVAVLPAGKEIATQIAVKATAKFDFAKLFSALVELFYSHDGNQTRSLAPVAGELHQIGVNATLQARF
jgi:hypothetical protein